MTDYHCWSCGATLEGLIFPISRREECAECRAEIHACRMCAHYDPAETSKQCTEDDAEKVQDKQAANFCDYFTIADKAWDAGEISAAEGARAALAALFGEGGGEQDQSSDDRRGQAERLQNDAEALFRK